MNRKRQQVERLADEELMALVGETDVAAFEVLYDRHSGIAYSLAYRIVGDRAAAEDVIQEAFVSAWRNSSRFDQARGSVRSWLLGIVRNRAIDLVRSRTGSGLKFALDGEDLLARRPAEERTDAEAIRHETQDEVRGAMGELPEEQMRVIGLAYFGGFSQSEIAEIVGVPLGTVKGRMRLGLEKIRGEMAEDLA